MNIAEIIFLGFGLAMDAVAVTMTNAMVYRDERIRKLLLMPILFGLFQAAMPVAGFLAGNLFAEFISRYSGIVIFIILGFIGTKMILDAVKEIRNPSEESKKKLTVWLLIIQAFATSIDAFAVGIGFNATGTNIAFASSIIGIVTALLVIAALFIGRQFGNHWGAKAEIVGGAVLLFIGIKSLII